MKVIWKDPEVERTVIYRTHGRLMVEKSRKWFKGPTKRKKPWYKYSAPSKLEYGVCRRNRGGFRVLTLDDDPIDCWVTNTFGSYRHKAKWCPELRMWRHTIKVPKKDGYRIQMMGLCIERVLTNWVLRRRRRRNQAAAKIQRCWKKNFPRIIFKQAKAHWEALHS